MKKVDNGIWEHKNYSIIRSVVKNGQKAYNIYKDGELIEIEDTLKKAQAYVKNAS